MIEVRALLRCSAAVAALALLAACAQTTPPAAPEPEPMRGAPLPAASRMPATGPSPTITTEPMRGAPLSSGASGAVTRGGGTQAIGTEPMRGAPLSTSTDQTTRP